MGHSEQLLFFALFYQSTPSCLKVIGGVECAGGHVVMCRRPCGGWPMWFSCQPKVQILFFFFFGGTFIRLGGLLGQGLGLGLGPGLDNLHLHFPPSNILHFCIYMYQLCFIYLCNLSQLSKSCETCWQVSASDTKH